MPRMRSTLKSNGIFALKEASHVVCFIQLTIWCPNFRKSSWSHACFCRWYNLCSFSDTTQVSTGDCLRKVAIGCLKSRPENQQEQTLCHASKITNQLPLIALWCRWFKLWTSCAIACETNAIAETNLTFGGGQANLLQTLAFWLLRER